MEERLTDRIRNYVAAEYVAPARRQGKKRLTVSVRDIRTALAEHEPMRGKSVVICQALQSRKFMQENGLIVREIEGPPSKKSPTVVMHYELSGAGERDEFSSASREETPHEWADRIVGNAWGLLRDDFAAYGGGEAFLKWVRSEENEAQ